MEQNPELLSPLGPEKPASRPSRGSSDSRGPDKGGERGASPRRPGGPGASPGLFSNLPCSAPGQPQGPGVHSLSQRGGPGCGASKQ